MTQNELQEDEYFNRKYHYRTKKDFYYLTQSEFDKLNIDYTEKLTDAELHQSLQENVDTEEIQRRTIFNRTTQKETTKRNADNVYLRSGFNSNTSSYKAY